ncbi:DUF4235 domain-containing protein [Intrasporangium sp.]|uniref:DUF4235 domain-containing protein n=1 Tax=Intrasporangium sp. TaxID=1925024 RepID=UPI0032218C36
MTESKHEGTQSSGGALGNIVWKVMTVVVAVVASRAATALAPKLWRMLTGRPVPVKSDYDGTRTRDVVAYTALSAMLLAGMKILGERKAAKYFRDSTGHLPAHLVETKPTRRERKAQKKLAKALEHSEAQAGQATT